MRVLPAVLLLLAVPATALADDVSLNKTWSRYLKAADHPETATIAAASTRRSRSGLPFLIRATRRFRRAVG